MSDSITRRENTSARLKKLQGFLANYELIHFVNLRNRASRIETDYLEHLERETENQLNHVSSS